MYLGQQGVQVTYKLYAETKFIPLDDGRRVQNFKRFHVTFYHEAPTCNIVHAHVSVGKPYKLRHYSELKSIKARASSYKTSSILEL